MKYKDMYTRLNIYLKRKVFMDRYDWNLQGLEMIFQNEKQKMQFVFSK